MTLSKILAQHIIMSLIFFILLPIHQVSAEESLESTNEEVRLFVEAQKRTLLGIAAGREQITESCMNPSVGLSPSDDLNKLKKIIEEEKEFLLIQNSSNVKKLLLLSNRAKELETKNCNVFQSLMENQNTPSQCGTSKKILNLVNQIALSLDEWHEIRGSIFEELFKISLLETNQCVSKNFTKTLKIKYDSFNAQLENKNELFFPTVIERLDLNFEPGIQ